MGEIYKGASPKLTSNYMKHLTQISPHTHSHTHQISTIRRYYLRGPKAGTTDVFIDNLPGLPDNISPNARGNGYWVSFAVTRTWLTDYMAGLPTLRWLIVRVNVKQFLKCEHIMVKKFRFAQLCSNQKFCRTLQNLMVIKFLMLPVFLDSRTFCCFLQLGLARVIAHSLPKHALVLELDSSGSIVRSLHDDGGRVLGSISHVLDLGDRLLLGSYEAPYGAVLQLDSHR